MRVVAEVVTYDAIDRAGFMACVEPKRPERIRFHLSLLPEPLHAQVVEASRVFNRRKGDVLSHDDFKAAKRAVVDLVLHKFFSLEVEFMPDGHTHIDRKSIRQA